MLWPRFLTKNLMSLEVLGLWTLVLADGCFFSFEKTNKDKLTEGCWLGNFSNRGQDVCSIMFVVFLAFGYVLVPLLITSAKRLLVLFCYNLQLTRQFRFLGSGLVQMHR